MSTDKIQIRPDSYDIRTPHESMTDLTSVPVASGFAFRPQVRSPDQGVSILTQVLLNGQSGDTPGGGDTFNMITPKPTTGGY